MAQRGTARRASNISWYVQPICGFVVAKIVASRTETKSKFISGFTTATFAELLFYETYKFHSFDKLLFTTNNPTIPKILRLKKFIVTYGLHALKSTANNNYFMKETRFKIYLSALVVMSAMVKVSAQSGPIAAGGECTGVGGTMSYSVGQIDYITADGSGGAMSEGLQQPYEIYIAIGVGEIEIALEMVVFPIPARDILNLQIDRYNDLMSFKLYGLSGNLIVDQKIIGKQTQIDLSGLSLSTYLLQVCEQGKEIKTFKIIKNI